MKNARLPTSVQTSTMHGQQLAVRRRGIFPERHYNRVKSSSSQPMDNYRKRRCLHHNEQTSGCRDERKSSINKGAPNSVNSVAARTRNLGNCSGQSKDERNDKVGSSPVILTPRHT
ncbi:hypothetical protein V3C99_001750 [Haemonchus contortus]